jgi:pyruvate ferredoxin oxidoreductase gamma subunit
MFQVRLHGRGGQGVVTSAELLSVAGFSEGRYTHAFPSFGSERMGAPVVSFCRIFVARIHPDRLLVVPATQLALEHLGRPLPGVPLLGGFAALTGQVRLESVVAAIRERFSGPVADGNAAAAEAAFRFVDEECRAAGHRVGAQEG